MTAARRWTYTLALLAGAAAAAAALGISAREASSQSAGPEFTDWTAVSANVASGTLLGRSISLSGSTVSNPPASTINGTSTVFNEPSFAPPLPTSDSIEFQGFAGFSYTLSFGAPVENPILHLDSLGSTLTFPAGTQIAKLSGESTFTVAGNTVAGVPDGPGDDASGTVRLSGSFQSLPFTAVFGGGSPDGIYLQVGAVPPATPPPTGSDPAPVRLEDLPPPVLSRSVNVAPVSGRVLVGVPAGAARTAQKGLTFVPLEEARQIRVGSFLQTQRGTVRLVAARDARGRRQSGDFTAGLFQVLQARSARGLTELRLKGSSFRRCGRRSARSRAGLARTSRRTIRRLRSRARGRFRTRGRYSAATVRGTTWDTLDRCDGTLTRVRRGRVAVRDFRRKRTVLVRAGRSYLARSAR